MLIGPAQAAVEERVFVRLVKPYAGTREGQTLRIWILHLCGVSSRLNLKQVNSTALTNTPKIAVLTPNTMIDIFSRVQLYLV